MAALDRARQSCAPGQRTPYDVQITLDAQETTRFKQHPPSLRAQEKMEIRPAGGDTGATVAVVLRTVLQNCRGVPFKGPRSLGGSRLKGASNNRGLQGGRGEGGKVNLPPLRLFNTRRWVGEFQCVSGTFPWISISRFLDILVPKSSLLHAQSGPKWHLKSAKLRQ